MTSGRSRFLAGCVAVAGVLSLAGRAAAQSDPVQPLQSRITELVRSYRNGAVEPALDGLATLAGAAEHEEAAQRWISRARNEVRRAELEGAVMLYSEAVVSAWARDDLFPERVGARYTSTLARLVGAVRSIDSRSSFLRNWYLFWETVRQGYIDRPLPLALDFLNEALSGFSNDADVHLAAGSRWELRWTLGPDNPRVDPRRPSSVAASELVRARDHFRRSVALDAKEPEPRLRLVRVLLELSDIDGAAAAFDGADWNTVEPAYAYLARLLEGALRERQRNLPAAVRAYEAAIAQTPQAQSARIARSHLAYVTGARPEAATFAIDAMSTTSQAFDPWWAYTKGIVWRSRGYLERLRQMVRP